MRLSNPFGRSLTIAFSALTLLLGSPTWAQSETQPYEPVIPETAGINLEGVAYPYPVHTYSFTSQGQPLEMAYMDVVPTGDDRGQAVLLLHGKNFNGAYWARTAADLAAQGYRVVIPDQIGFGKSTKPAHYQFTFQQLVRNTAGLLNELGIEDVNVLGHSMGGMIASRFAIDLPERTTRLILLNPIGLEDWKTFGVPYQSIDDWYESELGKSAEKVRAYQLSSYYDGKWDTAYDPWVELLTAPLQSPDYPRLAWNQALTYDMVFTQPVVYEFDEVQAPTLLIIGTRDRTALGKNKVSAEVAQTMGRYETLGKQTAEAIPNATLVELDDIGHLPHIEDYDRFIAALTGWLSETP